MTATNYGLVGLGVMGANLALNIADHGFPIAVYNRTASVTREFVASEARGKPIEGAEDIRGFVRMMDRPRRIIVLVKAGPAADSDRPTNLLLAPEFAGAVNELNSDWHYIVGVAHELGVPCPAMSSSLNYFGSYRSGRLPANLIQGLRDFFGAHTYRRIDREGYFHTEWKPQIAPEAAKAVPAPEHDLVGEDEEAERT